jgi:hypothetical protein
MREALTDLQITISSKIIPFYANNEHNLQRQISTELENALNFTREQLSTNSLDLINALNEVEVPIADVRDEVSNADENYLDIVGSSMYV